MGVIRSNEVILIPLLYLLSAFQHTMSWHNAETGSILDASSVASNETEDEVDDAATDLPIPSFTVDDNHTTHTGSIGTVANELALPALIPLPVLDVHIPQHVRVGAERYFNDVWERQVDSAVWSLSPAKPLLPWERGFAGSVFGHVQSNPIFSRPVMPLLNMSTSNKESMHMTTEPNRTNQEISVNAWKVVARRIGNLPFKQTEAKLRCHALQKWRALLQVKPAAFGICRLVMEDIFSLCSDDHLTNTLEDIVSMKSTRTILKRAMDLTRFVSWCQRIGVIPFPVQEHRVYQYVREYLTSASAPNTFKEALRFAGGLFQLEGALESAMSPRVLGFCNKAKASKAPTKQALVLTVRQVECLERLVTSGSDPVDSIMAGYCLFCLNGRARWNDAQFPVKFSMDRCTDSTGFLQADVRLTKTSTSAEKKAMLLPVTSIIDGIRDRDWADAWLAKRKACGLTTPGDGTPLMPEVLVNGRFGAAPLRTSEASRWIRELFINSGWTSSAVKEISTHSLKATTLSWAAKHGMCLQSRTILGYHVLSSEMTTLHYSRDALSGPLREMQGVYDDIRSNIFKPDESRSGYFTVARNRKSNQQSKTKSDSESSSSSSGPESSDESELSDNELLGEAIVSEDPASGEYKRRKLTVDESVPIYMHKRWHTLHARHKTVETKLACGRPVSDAYTLFPKDHHFLYARCKDCFGET